MLNPTSPELSLLEVGLAHYIHFAEAPGSPDQEQPLATHNMALQQHASHAPRPYLHPLRSKAGTVVTDAEPADHRHHLGLSVAFSDVNGTNFWGGSTYTAASGPTLLANHGRQVPHGWQQTPGEASGNVSWLSKNGGELAVEQRRIQYFHDAGAGTWALSLSSVIRPAADVPRLEVSSSAVTGREGAGYGGIFWRFPETAGEPLVLSEAGTGAAAAHGSGSRWLSIGMVVDDAPVTVLLAQETGRILPWFIRAEGYLGAGPAVAWDELAVVDRRRKPLKLALHAVIHDGPVDTASHALQLLDQHPLIGPGSHDRTP
jgi:hypothetical protein